MTNDHAGRYSQVALDEVELLRSCQEERTRLKPLTIGQGRCAGDYVVGLNSHFEYRGPRGSQVCMNIEMLGPSLLDLVKDHHYKGVPIPIVKNITRNMLTGLSFLHGCGIIHTDLKPENVLISLPEGEDGPPPGEARTKRGDPEMAMWWKTNTMLTDSGWKLRQGWSRTLYSRVQEGVVDVVAKIVDLGNACRLDKPYTQDIQTIEYRCPEVILGTGEHGAHIDIPHRHARDTPALDL